MRERMYLNIEAYVWMYEEQARGLSLINEFYHQCSILHLFRQFEANSFASRELLVAAKAAFRYTLFFQ